MPVSTDDLWSKANFIGAGTDEVDRRETVRLAYYSLYHDTRAFITRLGPGKVDLSKQPREPTGSHKTLAFQLKNGDHHADVCIGLRAFGSGFERAYFSRITADYRLSEHVRNPDVERQLKLVEKLRKQLDALARGK